MANWSEREIETAVEATFMKLGYPTANPEQLEAVKEFVKGKDVFVSTPTGSGKSLCYGSLPFVFDLLSSGGSQRSIVIVVSPLKALMLDQVQVFTAKGVSCAYVGAQDDCGDLLDRVVKGEFSLVFMSPSPSSVAAGGEKCFVQQHTKTISLVLWWMKHTALINGE